MANVAEFSIKFDDLKELNHELNTTEKKVNLVAKEAKKDFKALQLSIDPVARATKMFKDQVLIAQKAVATSAITQEEYSRTFKMIQNNAAMAGITLNQFGQVASVNARKMKRFGAVGMQQVGYQVQDFAVQVQGGTSMMVALGQQGSQLLGIFGPAGAIAGMILAIGTGLAGAFMAARGASEDAMEKFENFSAALKSAKEKIEELTLKNYMFRNGIEETSLALLKASADAIKAAMLQYDAMGTMAKIWDNLKNRFNYLLKGDRLAQLETNAETYQKLLDEIDQDRVNREKKESAKEEERKLEKIEELVLAYDVAARKAEYLADVEGRALEVRKQNYIVMEKLAKLEAQGLSISSDEYHQAKENLLIVRSIALANYDMAQLKKQQAQALKDQNKALRNQAKLAKEAHRLAKEAAKDVLQLSQSIADSMGDALMSMVDGTKSVKSAFKSMASDIIKELYRIFIVQRITGMISGAINTKFAPDVGITKAAIPSGDGGGYTGNGARSGGLDGKGGFMAMLHPQETVVDHTKGGSGAGVTVVQNINVTTGVQQTVRAEIRQLMPQIAASAKGAVLDAKRRGGSYGSSFA